MVKAQYFGLALLLCLPDVGAAKSWGDSKIPGPAKHWPVALNSVTITRSGHWQPDRYGTDTPAHCARFRPTPAEVQRWFRRANIVSQSYWFEQTEWTQCSADGTVVSGGRSYPWHLDQSGRGNVGQGLADAVFLSGPELPFRAGQN